MFSALIVPIATKAPEIWTFRACENREPEVFELHCLRAILGVKCSKRQRNKHVRKDKVIDNH